MKKPKLYKDEELNERLKQMFIKIKETLINCIIDDEFEFKFMEVYGLTSRQQISIEEILEKEFNKLTNNKFDSWCNNTIFHIVNGVHGALISLLRLEKIEEFTPEEMVDFIYNIIIYQIGDDNHSPSISEDLLIGIE
jgi:hypothetical protein